jgi:hypothetical protein
MMPAIIICGSGGGKVAAFLGAALDGGIFLLTFMGSSSKSIQGKSSSLVQVPSRSTRHAFQPFGGFVGQQLFTKLPRLV